MSVHYKLKKLILLNLNILRIAMSLHVMQMCHIDKSVLLPLVAMGEKTTEIREREREKTHFLPPIIASVGVYGVFMMIK